MPDFYIDPSVAGPGSGSINDPFSAWPATASNNRYFQKAGTTASANVTAFGRTNVFIGAYGSGARPIINGGSGVAFSSSGSSSITISGVAFVSTGNHAASHNGGNDFVATNCSFSGQRTGLNIISGAGAIARATITNNTFYHSANVNEASGLFVSAQSANQISDLVITSNVADGCAYNGIKIKAGDSDSASPIVRLTVTDNFTRNNGGFGIWIASDATTDVSTKFAQDAEVSRNTVQGNAGPGMTLTLRYGSNAVRDNVVEGNCGGGITGTGGLQMGGANNTTIERNICRNNLTATGFDGVGLYLDVLSGAQNWLGTSNCVVRRNECTNNSSYNPAPGTYQGNPPSGGITIYHGSDNLVYGNILRGNAAGVVINAWSVRNQVFNNLIEGNTNGIVYAWTWAWARNRVFNNVIRSNTRGWFTPDAGTRSTIGSLTLSATTGLVTVTSSASDFATWADGYAITAGVGCGFIVNKISSTQVRIWVQRDFTTTTFTAGNWALTYGQDMAGQNDSNLIVGNATDFSNGAGQSLTYGARDLRSTPADLRYGEPIPGNAVDFNGWAFGNPSTLGAVESSGLAAYCRL